MCIIEGVEAALQNSHNLVQQVLCIHVEVLQLMAWLYDLELTLLCPCSAFPSTVGIIGIRGIAAVHYALQQSVFVVFFWPS